MFAIAIGAVLAVFIGNGTKDPTLKGPATVAPEIPLCLCCGCGGGDVGGCIGVCSSLER